MSWLEISNSRWELKPRVKLLTSWGECLFLVLPAVFALLFSFQTFFSTASALSPELLNLDQFIALSLGLNFLHVVLTFTMLKYLPEFQVLRADVGASKTSRLAVRAGLIFFGTLFMTSFIYRLTDVRGVNVVPFVKMIIMISQLHHGLSQSRGIAQIYNIKAMQQLSYSPAESDLAGRCAARERIAWSMLVVMISGLFVIEFLISIYGRNSSWLFHLSSFFSANFRCLILFILVNSCFFPRAFRTNKFLFVARLLLFFPLSLGLLKFAVQAVHGFEYLFIYFLMVSNSSAGDRLRKKVHLISALWMAVSVAPLWLRYAYDLQIFTPHRDFLTAWWGFRVVAAATIGISFVHYFLDAVIFKMKDPVIRGRIGPLLSGNAV